jgi:hypothetical protein
VWAFIRLLLLRGGKREKKIKDEKTTHQKMLGGNKESQKMEYVHSPELFSIPPPSFQPNDWLTDVRVTKQKETRDILSKWDLFFL